MIKTIFLFWGGAVAVFDEIGEQMVELQGEDVRITVGDCYH